MNDTIPIYNLKAVMHEVGLSAATLRAWEQRYGLPKPQRTAGGHRLYSRQDIVMLKWLVERQNEGLSISRAVEMWKTLPEAAHITSGQIRVPVPEISTGEAMIDELRDQWIAACLVFDDQAANHTLDQAFAMATPETICTEVLQKGLAQIGEGWYAGSISVQQEHFASAIAIRRLNSLLAVTTPPTRAGKILTACPPGEIHDFVLLMISYLLRRGSWDVVYLGSNVPLNDLDATIQSVKPLLVLSAAQTLNSAASLRAMSQTVANQGVPLAYGGGIFNSIPTITQCISGHYLGTEVAMVPQMVERLLTASPPMPTAQMVSLEYTQTLERFLQNEAFIVGYVPSEMQAEPIKPAYVEIANTNLTRMISSALILGDINLLDHSVTWLNGMLKNRGLSTSGVMQFYKTYRQAVDRYLGDDGAVILDWTGKHLSSGMANG
jgi:DNA-binding transcriptional MerR regulator